ncbi:Maf-like protein YhdE [Roseimaritima multifibrata]|uniref:dTTP/UTP pyrophosphatase n=1 Tax=Roseimaritima multifibrata TaxID=1930274 RepID=A0A517MJY8_9BACT|nr:Maf family protein [Roseimaritima multifibrata]QDS95160.1 Maf-like protein YhdE [Roseimaritima multifibrata]
MSDTNLFADLPRGTVASGLNLILASGSPRRAALLRAAGYDFDVQPADDEVECGICSRETPPEMVARLAFRKAADVAQHHPSALILAADTVASCHGKILGKPENRKHAEEMLRLLRGRPHAVFTGICLWNTQSSQGVVEVCHTELTMDAVSDSQLNEYLDTRLWEGKAGAFGYQDGVDWLRVTKGSETNVVGLPMERLAEILDQFQQIAQPLGA